MRQTSRLWQRLVGHRPIVTRLVVAVAGAMLIVLVAAAAFVYWRVSFALGRQVDQDLDAWQQVVQRDVRQGVVPPTDDTPGLYYQLYDDRGRLVGGDTDEQRLLSPAQVTEVVGNGREKRFDVGRLLPPTQHPYRVLASRVTTPSGQRVVAAAISEHKHDEALRELLLQLAIADLIALAAASFVGYRTARAALDPVERYRVAAEQAGADATGRLPVDDRDDELSRLGHTLNDLLARIEAGAARERQFLADASHELRTPLQLMRAELDWARLKPRDGEQTATVLASLQAQVIRLVDLANALLDLEELRSTEDLRLEPVALPDVLADAVLGSVPHDVEVELDVDETTVRVDRSWLALAVANLVGNALRHGGGRVCVHADVRDGWLEVAVSDEGPGFAEDFVDTAFDRFSRAEQSRTTPGSGLGLSLVQAVATAHGGTAVIDRSRPGGRVLLRVPSGT